MTPEMRVPLAAQLLAALLAAAPVAAAPGGNGPVPARPAAPPATERDEKVELVRFCERFLEDYSAGRYDAVARMFAPGAIVVIDRIATDEQQIMTAAEFLEAARLRVEGGFREWISGKPVVLIDHKIATVWAPFELRFGNLRAGGTDVWQLVKLEGEWRIACLAFTNEPLPGPAGQAAGAPAAQEPR